jgi:hypothetical protein
MIPMLLLHISLALPAAALPPDAQRIALAEIATIWSPHGIVVAAASGQPSSDTVVVRVAVERRPASLGTPWGGPLASVTFDRAGMPVPVITLYLATLVEMIARAGVPGGGGGVAWPALLRDLALGRAVGRVLAHELGHFLLRSRWHAQSGLMRPTQSAADLAGPERALFELTAPDRARLAAVAAISGDPPTTECPGPDQ